MAESTRSVFRRRLWIVPAIVLLAGAAYALALTLHSPHPQAAAGAMTPGAQRPAPVVAEQAKVGDIPVVLDSCSATCGHDSCSFRRCVRPRCRDTNPEGVMNQDELKGKADQIKGKAKQAFGDLTDDEALHSEGKADEVGGAVQEGYGKARRKIGEAVEDVGKNLKR